ncbi:MAG TPA: hypothetical protein VFA45_00770 [Actinomycetes bacterium]|nr:hypothetical protein [Actinomycetes bacterium]
MDADVAEVRGHLAGVGAVGTEQARGVGSGSLSTARAAGSRGSGQVLAVPGAPWDRGAAGCNDLIRDGATLVRGLDDVLEALAGTRAVHDPLGAGGRGDASLPWRPWPPSAGRAAEQVLGALTDGQAMGVASLAAATGLAPATVGAALLELELGGFARRSTAGAEAIALPFRPATRGPPPAP